MAHSERFEKDEDSQIRQAMLGRVGKRKRHSGIMGMIDLADDLDDEDEGLSGSEPETEGAPQRTQARPLVKDEQINVIDLPETDNPPIPVVVGSALRRNEDGTISAPIVRNKSKKVYKLLFGDRRRSDMAEIHRQGSGSGKLHGSQQLMSTTRPHPSIARIRLMTLPQEMRKNAIMMAQGMKM